MCSDMTENDRTKQLIDALLPQSNSQSQTAIPEQKRKKKTTEPLEDMKSHSVCLQATAD